MSMIHYLSLVAGALRLVRGGICSGLIQVFASCAKSSKWFHLASSSFGTEEAKVACRELGCPTEAATSSSVSR